MGGKLKTLNDNGFTCPKIITDLPIDVMILIFKFLTPSERLGTTTVCHAWLQLVNEFFSKDHCLVLPYKTDIKPTGPLYKTYSDRLEITRHLRSFHHLIIKYWPVNALDLSNVSKFIELIGNEVKFLVINNNGEFESIENLFANMPNLENLEVPKANILRDLSSATNLETIKLTSTFKDLKILKYCREITNIKNLTVCRIDIKKKEIDDDSLMSFMEPHTKELLKQFIGSETENFITLESNFNFCSETKFSVDDVSGMEIKFFQKPLSQNILSKFQNLKKLRFFGENIPLVKYSGISHLELDGGRGSVVSHFDKLFKSFPDLESLSIANYCLTDDTISIICQFMPKLKELDLKISEISFEAIFATNQYSLKDLRLLEKLVIVTLNKKFNGNYEWPALPNLKTLSLIGRGFRYLNQSFYSQIAQNSPKITKITIIFYGSNGIHKRFFKFLPLIEQLQLTHLCLPVDEKDLESLEPLITKVSDHCKHLQELSITGPVQWGQTAGFSPEQKKLFFSRIPSLKKVDSTVYARARDNYDDFGNLIFE